MDHFFLVILTITKPIYCNNIVRRKFAIKTQRHIVTLRKDTVNFSTVEIYTATIIEMYSYKFES